jgi:hypothetical protein
LTVTAGIHRMTAEAYHADPTEAPSLSSSIARVLISQSPLHAYTQHPRLNPAFVPEEKAAFDLGTVVHQLYLEGTDDGVEVFDYPDWKKKAAQIDRDVARAQGLTPLLTKDWQRVLEMRDALVRQLATHEARPALFADGHAEPTLVWEEDGVTCRARLDWLFDDYSVVDDLKSTSRSAAPEAWSPFSMGYDIQAAFYLRGLRALTGVDATFRFVVVETSAPFALSVFELSPGVLDVADAKVEWAIGRWRTCVDSGVWPAYPTKVATVDLPPWAESQWADRETREAAA